MLEGLMENVIHDESVIVIYPLIVIYPCLQFM